jgi:hypothetical protein
VFEVKCLFAIDPIAAVYRADPARFENPCANALELGSAFGRADQLVAPPLQWASRGQIKG